MSTNDDNFSTMSKKARVVDTVEMVDGDLPKGSDATNVTGATAECGNNTAQSQSGAIYCDEYKKFRGEMSKSASIESDSISDSEYSGWWSLPHLVLTKVLWMLPIKDILSAGQTCSRWNAIANDEFMWKRKFLRHFQVDADISLKPGCDLWKNEYRRLTQEIPLVQAQLLEAHTHQVLHVSFAHNGEMFATCSKDGYVIIWNSDHPCTEKFSHNMKKFSWKYTQYSQFNQSDTLLLVSGVHFGSPHSTSGEIAVFTVDGIESHLRCRVVNRPYDIFGTWFSDQYLISGDLQWLAYLVSSSVLWLNKANQEIDSEHVPIMDHLYKFYNRNASSVRAIMTAKCPWLNDSNDPLLAENNMPDIAKQATDMEPCSSVNSISVGNPLSHAASIATMATRSESEPQPSVSHMAQTIVERGSSGVRQTGGGCSRSNDSTIRYMDEYRRKCPNESGCMDTDQSAEHSQYLSSDEEDSDEDDEAMTAEYDDMENSIPKYLIFSTGSKTYTPHQIGIKRIRNVTFPKKLDPGPSLKERLAAKRAAKSQLQLRPEPEWANYEAVADRFDKVDKVIDLHGHIIGMALSPDNRYLYVNTRPWPKNYVISNALEPPPIAQEIDIHVIDLMTLKCVGNMLRSHKAYTPSTDCFFIFLDVCDNYVASGAEDMHAYLWDRYYGICLAKYKHADVVNSVAFNPRDSEMLVTTSDDYTIKVWRSRAKAKEYNILSNKNSEGFELKKNK